MICDSRVPSHLSYDLFAFTDRLAEIDCTTIVTALMRAAIQLDYKFISIFIIWGDSSVVFMRKPAIHRLCSLLQNCIIHACTYSSINASLNVCRLRYSEISNQAEIRTPSSQRSPLSHTTPCRCWCELGRAQWWESLRGSPPCLRLEATGATAKITRWTSRRSIWPCKRATRSETFDIPSKR